ncbi:TetR/AcrR family transcriptional regulator [Marinactinospora thermotolerans]|uniref:TetR/AcrR family transcriptional regulator n=1 Tax=Marinactinospora thermotolerans TaxID=531310 RepID=UPI003D8FE1E4
MTERTRTAPRQAEAERNDRALLEAARRALALDGAHASVAAIASRAGVGIGSLYRRYRTKEELFQRLCVLALDHWIDAAEQGLAHEDPWAGIVHHVSACVDFGPGTMAPIAGTIKVTEEMAARADRCDEVTRALVSRAHAAGVLRPDVTATDLYLLVEQLGRSPLPWQIADQGRDELLGAATEARARVVAIALEGLRAGTVTPLPGRPPDAGLLRDRWEPLPAAG